MTEYKETLNLPKTSFAMKANLSQREPQFLKNWESMEVYQKIRKAREGRKPFILHDGPPYANGNIHIGHALNKILKDTIIKYKTLDGFDAPYVPGWDCHGLPIELQVEKKVGKAGRKIDHASFRKKCREYAEKQVDGQRKDFIRLGVFGDWFNPYKTMDFTTEANIVRSLARIVENGHLTRGAKPVHWCTDCGSALAEAEVEYQDKTSPAIDVKFNVVDEGQIFNQCHQIDGHHGEGPLSVVIWTTTPWTIPANQAVCLHPTLEYAVVQVEKDGKKERLFLAEALIKDCMSKWDIENYHIVAYGKGEAFDRVALKHPLLDKEVPLILGEHVTIEAGTGAVHTAPGHGLDDYIVGQKYGLEVYNPVGSNGVYLEGTPFFEGMHVYKANPEIIEKLTEASQLMHAESFNHSYPHCWRHKTPIIFRATPQWFVSMTQSNLRDKSAKSIDDVEWVPSWGKERIEIMMSNRPDWCISRQRTWGVPLSLFIHKQTGELHPNTVELMEKVAQKIDVEGIEAWFALEPQELLGDDAENYEKVNDTLDVWFDSGTTHFSVLGQRNDLSYPADLYLEGSDQHRGWFQSSLLSSQAINAKPPYKKVLTHGFTVDAQGKKMSKSIGNTIEPQEVNNKLGADILRLWVASTDYRAEMAVSDTILTRTADSYRRIRNTARFLLSNLNGFEPDQDCVAKEDMVLLDRWAVDAALQVQNAIKADLENYNFLSIVQKIQHFCSIEMGGFYLDIIKDRQYTAKRGSNAQRSCQTAMYLILEALVRWVAPILSFTAEEIWHNLPGKRGETVFVEEWFEGLFTQDNEHLSTMDWNKILQVKTEVNKAIEHARKNKTLGGSLEASVTLYVSADWLNILTKLGNELRFVLITSEAVVSPIEQTNKDAVKTDLDGVEIMLTKMDAKKCSRCWHRRDDIGQNLAHPELCSRCVENVDGNGEIRQFA
ncbi:MAG: isoleucine--tRNA ligase [Pseudomonadota bacterium]